MRNLGFIAFVVALCAAPTCAQTAHVAFFGGPVADVPLPNAACGPTAPQLPGYGYPPQPLVAPPPAGAYAFDHMTNLMYVSEGGTIEIFPHPLYAATAAPFPPGPAPLPPMPCFGAGGIAFPFGPITGMAMVVGPVAPIPAGLPGVLMVTDGFCIAGLTPFPPYAVVIPPAPAMAATFAAGPLTGLEWDSMTGTLWGCDAAGFSYPLLIGGGLAGAPVPPPAPPLGPIGGNVFDRSVAGGALYNTDGVFLYPVVPAGPPIPLPPGTGVVGPVIGATYVAEPVTLGGACGCATPGAPTAFTDTTTAGLTGIPITVGMTGGPPGAPAWLAIDFACAGPTTFGVCSWWLPLAPAFLFGPFPLDATGAVGVPFAPLPPLVGTTFYAQFAYACPLSPVGLGFTDALHGRGSMP